MFRPAFFLLLALVAAYGDNFTVTFDSSEDFPGEPDQYIEAEFAGQLKKANPNTIQDGRFYLRQKFEDPFEDVSTYQLYEGKATPAKGNLGKFSFSDAPYSTLLRAKFFLNPGATGDFDIEKVYFDGKSVFVEGDDPIYVQHKGRMVKMEASQDREFFIELSSQPSGATVTLDGQSKGTTPLKFSLVTANTAVVTVSKSGFYNSIRVIKPVVGRVVQDGVLLTPKKELDNPLPALRARFSDLKRRQDRQGLTAHRNSTKIKIDGWSAESRRLIDGILANYPPNPGQRGDEEAAEYRSRTQVWESDRKIEATALEEASKSYLMAMESLLKEIDDELAIMPAVAAVAPPPPIVPVAPPSQPFEPEEEEDTYSDEPAEDMDVDQGYVATDERDEAVDDAVSEVRARFSNTDEYIRYGAYALMAGFVGAAVVAVLQHTKYSEAKDAFDGTQTIIDSEHANMRATCASYSPGYQERCFQLAESQNPALNDESFGLYTIQSKNKSAMDSYQGARNLWVGGGGILLAGSIVLFSW